MASVGYTGQRSGNAATVHSPVITPMPGGPFTEGLQDTATNAPGAAAAMANIPLAVTGYESKTAWISNQTVNGFGYDITASFLPALQAARDYGLGKAIAAYIKADSNVTQSTTTASTTTVT